MTDTTNEIGHAVAYSMALRWDAVDRIYVVDVPELPGCHTHGRTRAEAVAQGEEAIATWIAAARAGQRPLPAPRVWTDEDAESPYATPATASTGS
jgi:predicted RNase H-like HicB family nuclease